MQGEDIIEHTNGMCHLRTFWSICRSLCNIGMHLINYNIIEHTHAKILINTLECQVSWGGTYGEVVKH